VYDYQIDITDILQQSKKFIGYVFEWIRRVGHAEHDHGHDCLGSDLLLHFRD